jgi:ubiquitin-protein ligase
MSLARELAILSTSLPPGVFLRADEERIDVVKALMAGPADSPYAYGLFEFDIFFPLRTCSVLPLHKPTSPRNSTDCSECHQSTPKSLLKFGSRLPAMER